jgi:hypothetical protein
VQAVAQACGHVRPRAQLRQLADRIVEPGAQAAPPSVSSDSSAKSIAASTCTRIASTCAISASTRRENTPVQRTPGGAGGAFVAGGDQVGDRLGLGEVELAVEEGALG